MITKEEFDSLHTAYQSFVLISQGEIVGDRKYEDVVVFLYQIENFFVEVHARNGIIVEEMYSVDDSVYPLYLDNINIKDLYK